MGRGRGSGAGSGSRGGAGAHLRTHNDNGGGGHHYQTNYHHNSYQHTTTPHTNYHHNDNYYSSSNSSSVNESAGCCACCCCLGFILLFLVKGLLATWIFSSSSKITMDVGETRLLGASTYNTLFDQRLHIRDHSGSVRVYHVSTLPPLSTNHVDPLLLTDTRTIASCGYNYFTYFLNPGSVIKVEFSSNIDLDMLLIRGKSSFEAWADEPDVSLVTATKFSTHNQPTQFTYTVPPGYGGAGGGGGDEYYIVFDNFEKYDYQSATVSFSLVIIRNTYQLESYHPICDAATPLTTTDTTCHIPLTPLENSFYILQSPAPAVAVVGAPYSEQTFDVEVWCDFRWSLVLYLLGAGLLCGVGGKGLAWWASQAEDRSASVSGYPYQSQYQSQYQGQYQTQYQAVSGPGEGPVLGSGSGSVPMSVLPTAAVGVEMTSPYAATPYDMESVAVTAVPLQPPHGQQGPSYGQGQGGLHGYGSTIVTATPVQPPSTPYLPTFPPSASSAWPATAVVSLLPAPPAPQAPGVPPTRGAAPTSAWPLPTPSAPPLDPSHALYQ